jgi:phosphoribosylaminoimidazole-succinocarboxamide synthase
VVVSADALTAFLPTTLSATSFDFLGDRYQGKVRDVYTLGDERFLIATDRQSAFDINWTTIPLKGQVLSQLSAWWIPNGKIRLTVRAESRRITFVFKRTLSPIQ